MNDFPLTVKLAIAVIFILISGAAGVFGFCVWSIRNHRPIQRPNPARSNR